MPATSRKQYRWMKAVESGSIKAPGLSREKAAEYTAGQSPERLPERVKRKSLSRIVRRGKQNWKI